MNNEYNITLEQAKKTGMYTFTIEKDLQEVMADIERMKQDTNFYKSIDVVAVLEFGFVDIELTYRDNVGEFDYCICVNFEGTGWETYEILDILPLEIHFAHMQDREQLEKIMFNLLMQTIKKRELTWSKEN